MRTLVLMNTALIAGEVMQEMKQILLTEKYLLLHFCMKKALIIFTSWNSTASFVTTIQWLDFVLKFNVSRDKNDLNVIEGTLMMDLRVEDETSQQMVNK